MKVLIMKIVYIVSWNNIYKYCLIYEAIEKKLNFNDVISWDGKVYMVIYIQVITQLLLIVVNL